LMLVLIIRLWIENVGPRHHRQPVLWPTQRHSVLIGESAFL
jgi:hypothetical protein